MGSAVWVETGTYLGRTSKWLASHESRVITIEPDERLVRRARRLFKKRQNVSVIQGSSERVFVELLPELRGNVSFWLDGHFSGGITASGESETPIRMELAQIEVHRHKWSGLNVFVDDFRCFDPKGSEPSTYPSRAYLVDWAVRNNLSWTVEHDIFVASTSLIR